MQKDLSEMSAAELDALIAEASKRRAALEPRVAGQPPDALDASMNPAWSISLVEQGSMFRVRHPGLGWMAFLIPATERAILLSALLQQALIARPEIKVSIKPGPGAAPGAGGSGEVVGGSVH